MKMLWSWFVLPVLLKCLLSQAAARNVRRRPSRPDIRQKFGKNQNVLQHLNRPLSGRLTSRNIGALGTEPIIRLDPIGEEIEKAAWKGRGLLADIFLQSDQQPPFDMSFDTMKQNGWTVILYPMYETPVQLEGGSKKMAHDLGILTEELEMKWYDAVALFEKFDDKNQKVVDIKIELAVNPVAGMMMATNLLVKRNLDGTKNLQRFSDVAWILWREACKEENVDPGTSLKYVVHWSVANDKTQLVVGSVLGNLNLDVDDRWPGHTLDMNADAGHTVLGAPNGYGIGFMLKDYKKFFKGRTVLSATSYECEIPQAAD